ncbi:MAG: DNA topoisomerase 4 subunit A [Firmicutes bacterium]|nr:DNA topoisomerase 4 subunit A [Bacillota bacterium]
MSENKVKEIKDTSKLFVRALDEVMHDSMMPYSEYVILDRALPRVEDGLKPVQRRILYTMHELGLNPDKPHRKSARIVGDCLGKFHPHGDKSVYDAMVRMAQPFSMRAPLVDGQGNFGSIDGDGAAAMRYTEAKMTPLALELLRDLEKNTVKWNYNFDDTMQEPDVLPGRFPNLLVNGASGIAVGLATNIPPHNLSEVIDGVVAYIDNPKIGLKEMMRHIKGPDFPGGGYVVAGEELEKAYETGRGKIYLRAKMHIENAENDKKLIVIDELPYMVNKSALLENIMKVREEKKGILMGISEITDESDHNGMRAVIRIKKDHDPRAIADLLFKATSLSSTFGINIVAIADGKPQQMGLMEIISYYVAYQREIILRRSKYELEEARERAHILEGLVIAVRNIDEVIKIIKSSQNTSEAKERLRARFTLSEKQAQAILDMRLARLTSLEILKLEKELKEIKELIVRLEAIVASKKLQMDLVKTELLLIRKAYRDNRKSMIIVDTKAYAIPAEDDEKPIEDYVVAYNALGNIKRMTAKTFKMALKDFTGNSSKGEICDKLIKVTNRENIFIFTNLGNCYKVDVDSIPDGKWRDKGAKLKALLPDSVEGETIIRMLKIEDPLPKKQLLFYTAEGMVKKSDWSEYGVVKSAFQAIKLKDGDTVIGIEDLVPKSSLLFITEQGMSLNADMSDIPVQGRVAGGVKGIQLNDGDKVVFVGQVTDGEVLIITDSGWAKRVKVSGLDVMARYRKGVKIADLPKAGAEKIVFAKAISGSIKFITEEQKDEHLTVFNSDDCKVENRTNAGKALFRSNKVRLNKVMVYNDNYTE